MATAKNRSLLFSSCSLFMASLFAYSASVQFNDPDWYFWFPLYASAAAVNLLHTKSTSKTSNQIAKLGFGFGMFLFLKVLVEGYVNGSAGFLCLNMNERVVREKMGSGLVVISMFLQLRASRISKGHMKRKGEEVGKYVEWGMALVVAVCLGLSLAFFVLVKEI
ncbi:uncharacterized protein LOC131229316 [Magnolia sinica]|uniref:uncharacterized protein LOC131229316 n=1 Tax=Magnolia sinica TaxID=86752 RepID=UPI00265858C3|nr:uncharacterized protein LOC131229316 [Magnolia sinica]